MILSVRELCRRKLSVYTFPCDVFQCTKRDIHAQFLFIRTVPMVQVPVLHTLAREELCRLAVKMRSVLRYVWSNSLHVCIHLQDRRYITYQCTCDLCFYWHELIVYMSHYKRRDVSHNGAHDTIVMIAMRKPIACLHTFAGEKITILYISAVCIHLQERR